MAKDYNYAQIEKKWQDIWDEKQTFAAKDDYSLPKFYGLVEFPYPSGQGLHVGHPRSYTAIDIVCRKKGLRVIMCFTLWGGTHSVFLPKILP